MNNMDREKFVEEMELAAGKLAHKIFDDAERSENTLILSSVPKERLPDVYKWNRDHQDLKIDISKVCMMALRKALLKKEQLLIDREIEE